MNNNVIGPISHNDWTTLQMLKESKSFYRAKGFPPRYQAAWEKEDEIYTDILNPYLTKTAH